MPVDTPSTKRWGQKVKTFFVKGVMLHIKLKGIEHRAQCKHIICPNIHPGVKKSNFFSEYDHVAWKRNIDQHRNKNFDLTHAPDLWVRLKGQILKLYR